MATKTVCDVGARGGNFIKRPFVQVALYVEAVLHSFALRTDSFAEVFVLTAGNLPEKQNAQIGMSQLVGACWECIIIIW